MACPAATLLPNTMWSLLVLALALLAMGAICYWNCTYWRRHGVEGPRGWPLCGNMLNYALGREPYSDIYQRLYSGCDDDLPYVGIYRLFNEPAVLVRSQELLKELMIRNFQYFENNVLWIDPKRDPIIVLDPFVARGESWRRMRSELLAIFTPNKIKQSLPHITAVCARLDRYVGEVLDRECFEAKKLCVRYTLDVVSSAGFGLNAQSFSETNAELFELVESIFQPSVCSLLDTIALLHAPNLGHLISYRYVPLKVQRWLRSVLGSLLARRLDTSAGGGCSSSSCNDMMQWLVEARQRANKPVDEAAIVGHCSTILIEGYETSATLMAFALYEYAVNPAVQQSVHAEIDRVLARYEGELCQAALTDCVYLEASLYETLRLHPAMMALLKHCTESFVLPPQRANANSKPFTVPRGMVFVVPVKAIHYDPALYPEPELFMPERFAAHGEAQRLGCRFLGFGEGARMCPGMRFGLAQSKAALLTLLRKYNVYLARNAPRCELSATTFLTASQEGIWLRFEERP